jgi:cyclophilin family peptidyl-prolyl cis-trans isomerase
LTRPTASSTSRSNASRFEQPKQYTVFGRVIEGIGNADIISNAPVSEGTQRPADKIIVRSITLQPRANFK